MRILILGGYGVFGGRLAELLADVPDIEILICGRNIERAAQLCNRLHGAASLRPVLLDRLALHKHTDALKPDLVVDASGPFQDYGETRYSVIETCIRCRVNYVDFADAADFVFGVSKFDEQARNANIFVLSGASSFPVLSAAVVRELSKSMEIASVHGGIAPSPYAGIGLNVMRAVVGYAGSPVKLLRNGVQTTAPGLTESMRYTIAVPGRLPLRNIRFSLVDVPDLQVIPPEHPTIEDIWIGAGPVPESLHRLLILLAKSRAKFNLPSFGPMAPLFFRVLKLVKFGEDRGGMFVHVIGHKNGVPVERSWHLLAEGSDGPYIPSMAIEAIVRKLLRNEVPNSGARPATRALDLADYERLFENRSIWIGFRDSVLDETSLYRQILGDAYDALPDQIQAIHGETGDRSWQGAARVRRGKGLMSMALGWVFGFPYATDQTSVTVRFSPCEGGERWVRTFGQQSFSSVQTRGTGKNQHLIIERFGPIKVALALVIKDEKLGSSPLC